MGINLLPSDLTKNTPLSKTAGAVKTIQMLGTIVFGILLILYIGVVYVGSVSLKKSRGAVDELKGRINDQKSVEEQYFLVKERLKSISEVYAGGDALKGVTDLVSLNSDTQGSGQIYSLDLSSAKADLVVNFDSSLGMVNFFKTLAEKDFSKIIVETLSYNPETGYRASIEFTK